MNEIQTIDKKIEREVLLGEYKGKDRVIYAEEKKAEIQIEKANRPPFYAQTGISSLDECTDGFRKGQLIVVSGPPKHGKTALCQTLTKHFIAKEHKVLWLPYELTYEEMF